jgi:hypothetical protein
MLVKISSEEASSIALTPVVVQDMPVRELVELMLGVTGKDPQRIRELLKRGTFVSGASRFRWTGVEMDVTELLTSFPNPDPSRRFDAGNCVRAFLRGGARQIELPRNAALKKRLFQSGSFWDLLIAAVPSPQYLDYSFKERADIYRARVDIEAAKILTEGSKLLAYSVLADQVRTIALDAVDFYLPRE